MLRQTLCILTSMLLALCGVAAVVVAIVIIVWPVTNTPIGKADNWSIATPYIATAIAFFASSLLVAWWGFKAKQRQADGNRLSFPPTEE